MNKELLPCPFCGGEAYQDYVENKLLFRVECRECGVSGNIRATPGNAIAAWNNRTNAPPIAQSVQPTVVNAVEQDVALQVFTVKGMPLRGKIVSNTPCDLCGKTWGKHFDVFCFDLEAKP